MSTPKETTKVFKVVMRVGDRLLSAYTFGNWCQKDYKIGLTTTPIKGTKLFAFNKLEDALKYATDWAEVYEAEATGISDQGKWFPSLYLSNECVGMKKFRAKLQPCTTHPSSVLCSSIKLVKRVSTPKVAMPQINKI